MTVTIKGHTYEMTKKAYKQSINNIKKMIPKGPTILAIEKDGHAEMRNDCFKNQKDLTEAVKNWNNKGYLVKFTRGL